jgi:N-acetylglucosamine-6-sulfatase
VLRPRLVAVSALFATLLTTAACSSGGVAESGSAPLTHPEVGWLDGRPHATRAGSAPSSSRPNIVFVLTDDLSWNLVPYMPHVLAMQRAGATFRNYFVTDSLCCPSRTSIFTGEFPHNSGVYDNSGSDGGFDAFLAHADENKTFASDLQGRGYLTGFFGKFLNLYHPHVRYAGQRPYAAPGWSAWDAAGTSGYDEFNYLISVGHHIARYGSAPGEYLTSVLSNKVTRFISTSVAAHRPFMTEISTFAPHAPFTPAPQDVEKFPGLQAPHEPSYGRAVENPPAWLAAIPPLDSAATDNVNRVFRLRVQAVQSVDRMISRLEAELQRLGVADSTYLVFSSDNGFHLGDYDLRPGKQTAFDTDISVPLVVTGPGVPAGSTVSQLAQNIDLAPTFDDLAGATPPTSVNGRTLVRQLHGKRVDDWRNAVLVEHHGPTTMPSDPDYPVPMSGNPPSYEAIRTTRYLYVEYIDGEHEFYNLRTDPFELDNRYATMPAQLRSRLHAALLRMSSCHGSAGCWRAQHVDLKPSPNPGKQPRSAAG